MGARGDALIRVDTIWLGLEPLDMRAGTESALARVVSAFGAARAHHGYVFLNRRCDRLKVLVCDGIWLAARRLHGGSFARVSLSENVALSRSQFDALVLGLPWQRMGEHGAITVV